MHYLFNFSLTTLISLVLTAGVQTLIFGMKDGLVIVKLWGTKKMVVYVQLFLVDVCMVYGEKPYRRKAYAIWCPWRKALQ